MIGEFLASYWLFPTTAFSFVISATVYVFFMARRYDRLDEADRRRLSELEQERTKVAGRRDATFRREIAAEQEAASR